MPVAASLTVGLRQLLEGAQAAVHRGLRRRGIRAGGELAKRLGRMTEAELCSFAQRIREGVEIIAGAKPGHCSKLTLCRAARFARERVSATTARSSSARTVSAAPISARRDSIASQLFA